MFKVQYSSFISNLKYVIKMLHFSSKFSFYQHLLTSSRLKTVFLLSTNHRVEMCQWGDLHLILGRRWKEREVQSTRLPKFENSYTLYHQYSNQEIAIKKRNIISYKRSKKILNLLFYLIILIYLNTIVKEIKLHLTIIILQQKHMW